MAGLEKNKQFKIFSRKELVKYLTGFFDICTMCLSSLSPQSDSNQDVIKALGCISH